MLERRSQVAIASCSCWHRSRRGHCMLVYNHIVQRSHQGCVPCEVRSNWFCELLLSEEPVAAVQLSFDDPFAVWQHFDRKPSRALRMQQIWGTIPDPSAGTTLGVQVVIAVVVRRPLEENATPVVPATKKTAFAARGRPFIAIHKQPDESREFDANARCHGNHMKQLFHSVRIGLR